MSNNGLRVAPMLSLRPKGTPEYISWGVMVVYSILLIQLNHRALPETIKIRSYSLGTLVVSALFFGYFSTVYIIDQAHKHLKFG